MFFFLFLFLFLFLLLFCTIKKRRLEFVCKKKTSKGMSRNNNKNGKFSKIHKRLGEDSKISKGTPLPSYLNVVKAKDKFSPYFPLIFHRSVKIATFKGPLCHVHGSYNFRQRNFKDFSRIFRGQITVFKD